MVELCNRETAFEPRIAPLTPELFIELVEAKSYFDPAGLAAIQPLTVARPRFLTEQIPVLLTQLAGCHRPHRGQLLLDARGD